MGLIVEPIFPRTRYFTRVKIIVQHIRLADAYETIAPQNGTPLTSAEEAFMAQSEHFFTAEGAYAQLQGTRPATLAAGLSDSPAGLAAWMVEKFRA